MIHPIDHATLLGRAYQRPSPERVVEILPGNQSMGKMAPWFSLGYTNPSGVVEVNGIGEYRTYTYQRTRHQVELYNTTSGFPTYPLKPILVIPFVSRG